MIQVDALNKHFGSIHAVKDVSLEIPTGQIFGLLGPNGAGKSTSISIMTGLIDCDSGSVALNGLNPQSKQARFKIGLIPQSIALYEELSAVDNLSFFASLYDIPKNKMSERMDWALEFVGLSDRANDRVSQFSGGMKRRLNLAASLLHDPDYIFMDEPTAGVDPQSRNKLFENVLKLKELGKTVIYTTHYMEEAQKLCDKVGIIDHGQLLALGTVDELLKQYGGDTKVSISSEQGVQHFESGDVSQDLLEALKKSNKVYDISMHRPDLETVFLNLTGRQLRD
ncbi:ABC transporter ATP-binding protein [Kangiella spongicola]|uniref:ABC transporter ATP-binding protein n=1 Tax=Kangiella spongicola TaxID=796379 RepID=A0A318D6X3_9GAMM|nr:ABC transporter ATP-binding protein [Kangiella spongicola]PXF63655.1 ABC transporter ATP-binding protein [Kangiella spongicola]